MNFDFQNGPDSILLVDGEVVLDAIGYGVFAPDEFFAGEGSPAPDAPAGSSLARVFADLDSGRQRNRPRGPELADPGKCGIHVSSRAGYGSTFGLGTRLDVHFQEAPT